MPLINSGGVTQTPWSEGQHVRQLEPMGFIKFDILGLSTLKMIEGAVYHILKKQGNPDPTFEDIKKYYDKHLHPEKINLKIKRFMRISFGKVSGLVSSSLPRKARRTSVSERSQRTLLTLLLSLLSIVLVLYQQTFTKIL